MLLINLFAQPGAGKSTGAAYIFSKLKMLGINTELVTEFAKDKVWEGNNKALENQAFVFGSQYYKITRCMDQVDVIVTDSPLLLSVMFNRSEVLGEEFNKSVAKVVDSFKNNSKNYLINRVKPYNPKGRLQTEAESDKMADDVLKLLKDYNVDYRVVNGDVNGYEEIIKDVYTIIKG